jgi:hypothetical protein
MRVLVGADGRVKDVQVTRGIGLGLPTVHIDRSGK